ncbi:MAG: hypothetical protein M1818_005021 [Claussenomyces sp. TS43310]|nr:MAG: hypothetical protein M1818_005021 [Claussenomyces sp. TS43310]
MASDPLDSMEPPCMTAKSSRGEMAGSSSPLREDGLVTMPPMTRQHETISLLPAEQLLRQLLLDCRDELPDPALSELEMWFTGGWFGNALRDFFSRNGAKYMQEAQRLGVPPEFKGLHKTAKKPDKSKHLETCTAHVFSLDVDLVNLRKETYTQDSRNPQVKFGTAEEDAFRRDAMVNALFYNLDNQQVEDFTGKGLQDMATGLIRTPLDPYETFMDDPLRVLRVIRFASKLGYTIDEDAEQSMKDERIHIALDAKISRERVGIELGKMMSSRNPLMAFELIYDMGLYSTVFLDPSGHLRQALTNYFLRQQMGRPWPSTWPSAYRLLASLADDTTNLGKELVQSEGRGESCWLMAAYAPIAGLMRTNVEEVVKDVTEAIKATSKSSKLVEDALKHMDEIRSTVDLVADHDHSESSLSRSTVGIAIKSWGVTWKLQVLYSLLAEAVYEASDDCCFAAQLARYSQFVDFVLQQDLQDAPHIQPILNGDDIKGLFRLEKVGAFMKRALDGIVTWQFDNRDSSRDDATKWLRTQKEHLGIP